MLEKELTNNKGICVVQKILVWVVSVALLLTGIGAGALAIHISLRYPSEQPVLLEQPEEAISRVTAMMDAICEGDYDTASTYFLGMPSLGVTEAPGNVLGAMLWDAFLRSTEYELTGACYTTDTGLAQNVSFTYLDTASVTANLRERAQELLNQRVEEADDVSEIYDENNEFREEIVMEALQEALQASLAEDAKTTTVTLTVNLKNQNGQWWVVADSALLDAFAGGARY